MKYIAIVGASGFVGQNLIRSLLRETEYYVRAIAPDADTIATEDARLEKVMGDVFDYDGMKKSLHGVAAAYYLVHMMGGRDRNFYDAEACAAETFGRAAADVSRVIYMGGLGRENDHLSKHLASRHNTGNILRACLPRVIEFRASMIIGPGSISFEIVKSLVRKLPIIILPKWAKTRTQPIAIKDALKYLVAAIEVPLAAHEIVEIGGPAIMSYQDFLRAYANLLHKKIILVRVPILPEWMAGWWFDPFTSKIAARVGRNMVESFRNEMIVTNSRARELFPDIHPRPVEEDFL